LELSVVLNVQPSASMIRPVAALAVFLQDRRDILRKCRSAHIAHLRTEMRCRTTCKQQPRTVRFIASRPLPRLEILSSEPAQRSYQGSPTIQ